MTEITVQVEEQIAWTVGDPEIVCGNSDYTVRFDFDSAWDGVILKIARFIWKQGRKRVFQDVLFTGNTVGIPALYDTKLCLVGVYAGNIRTTGWARIPCVPCITSGDHVHPAPQPDIYAQLLAYLERAQAGGGYVSDAVPETGAVLSEGVFLAEEEERE